MSYLTFHVAFTLTPLLVLVPALPQSLRSFGGIRAQVALPVIAIVAFVYTAPWDNYLIARGIWWYGPDRVLLKVGHVPLEEYLFFLLQPLITGLFYFNYRMRQTISALSASHVAWIGFLGFFGLSAAGYVLLLIGPARATYAAFILSWSCPLLAGMWLYDGRRLWAERWTLIYAAGLPTVYFCIADAVAIGSSVWTISDRYTVGLSPFGLPIEEALFFLMTNLLVVHGLILLIENPSESSSLTTRKR